MAIVHNITLENTAVFDFSDANGETTAYLNITLPFNIEIESSSDIRGTKTNFTLTVNSNIVTLFPYVANLGDVVEVLVEDPVDFVYSLKYKKI